MNKNMLEAEMKLYGDTGTSLAKALGIGRGTFSMKLNNKGAEFNQSEIAIIKSRYKLSPKKIDLIFFGKEVS